jgi:hypothetical protein
MQAGQGFWANIPGFGDMFSRVCGIAASRISDHICGQF